MPASEIVAVASATAEALARSYPGARASLKRDILSSALACFNEHGLEPTTIDMIKVRCGTSVGNIYHHFGNKDGVVAALFFSALDDQSRLREGCLATAQTAQQWVAALVYSYVDWVTAQPELARFQFQARSAVSKGPQAEALAQRNRQRNRQTLDWLAQPERRADFRDWPAELLPSLVIGQSENYCRAWLSGRVRTSPTEYREQLAEAAWHSVSASQ
ncbi:TetR/AcrR family transcriptional regulator [Pseudomonas sp. NA-150]|uniref:TetR/AcrR family transcriptional regulator n=1 Tax=Pseudomonas sp. NA-150 TaxID=3367525 RepID=UPI0037CB59BF